jgi:hypothetical protein
MEAHSLSFGAVCLRCRRTQPPLDKVAEAYFGGEQLTCGNPECGRPIDYCEATLDTIGSNGIPTITLVSVGAQETFFGIELGPEEIKSVDLTKHGVPADATILGVSFTALASKCFPLLIHGNTAYPFRPGTQFKVYGLPLGSEEADGSIEVTVAWAQKDDLSNSWSYLLDAFEAMASRSWRSVILPAYSAFEVSLSPLVLEGLAKHLPSKIVDNFEGDDSFSSSTALNVLLPLLCKEAKIPELPRVIQTELNKLRKLRNRIAHEGVEKTAVNQEGAGAALCAAVFGLEYLRFVRRRLLPPPSEAK